MEDKQAVCLVRNAGIATIVISNERRKNALTGEMWEQLHEHITQIERERCDRVVVVTGMGADFCSGADLSSQPSGGHPLQTMAIINSVCHSLFNLSIPTIAKVRGVAVGGGMNLALCCDFVIASETARFAQIFSKRGLSVDTGGSWLLPRIVGLQRAKDLVFTARTVHAEEAFALGIAGQVVAPKELDDVADALATNLAMHSPVANAMSKRLLNDSFGIPFEQALYSESLAVGINALGPDSKEIKAAFMEKRQPRFRGFGTGN